MARAPWIHRIDAVPRINRRVKFRLSVSDEILTGTVLLATRDEQARFAGIGGDVVYQNNGRRFLSNQVEYWRYDR